MRYIYGIIGIAIIGLLIYVLWPRETVVIDNSKVKELQYKLSAAETKRAAVIASAKKDSAEHAAATKAKDSEILRWKRAAAKSRTSHVDTVLIQDKEVGMYAAFLDSIIVNQDTLIASLKDQKISTWRDFNALISASDSVNTANIQLNKHFQSSLEEANEANKKLTRQNRGLKIGIVAIPVAIGILLIAN